MTNMIKRGLLLGLTLTLFLIMSCGSLSDNKTDIISCIAPREPRFTIETRNGNDGVGMAVYRNIDKKYPTFYFVRAHEGIIYSFDANDKGIYGNENFIEIEKGNFVFDISEYIKRKKDSLAIAMADYDKDGDGDLFLMRGNNVNEEYKTDIELFINNNNAFTGPTVVGSVFPASGDHKISFDAIDIDDDGDIDFFSSRVLSDDIDFLYSIINKGGGEFEARQIYDTIMSKLSTNEIAAIKDENGLIDFYAFSTYLNTNTIQDVVFFDCNFDYRNPPKVGFNREGLNSDDVDSTVNSRSSMRI